MKKKKNALIAITGGIGSGKSTALNIIKSLGYNTLSCDKITAELYLNQKVLRKLKKIFPSAISGKVILEADKREISRLAFSNPLLHKQLTDYLASLTFKIILKRASKLKGLIFIEVPLLFECEKQDYFDKILVVTRNLEDRISSVISRSGLDREKVLQRIATQYDYSTLPSDVIEIDNNQSKQQLTQKLKTAISNIIKVLAF